MFHVWVQKFDGMSIVEIFWELNGALFGLDPFKPKLARFGIA